MVLNTGAVVLREYTASDGAVLDEVFAGLSVQSRYLRYLTSSPALPVQARRVLNAVDGSRHVAVVAFADGKAIGIGRLIGLDRHRAELAVEVVDEWQGRGVGMLLGTWIRDRAAALGYSELVAETSAANVRAHALTRKLFPDFTARRAGTAIVFTLPVNAIHPTAA
jgi:GNAT superfamily N-acetyltransferase